MGQINEEFGEANRRYARGYAFQRTDPFGFWIILGEDGERPAWANQEFTTVTNAKQFLDNILDQLDKRQKTKAKKAS